MGSGDLTPNEFSAAVTAITAAFGDPTRRQIYLLVRENPEGVSAGEVARAMDLHTNVARHHLEKLAAAGHLKVSTDRPASGVGRPSKLYSASEPAMTLAFPVRRDDLLGVLAGRALALLPPKQAQALAEEVGAEYGTALAQAIEPDDRTRSIRSAVAAVAEALTSHGFSARTEGGPAGLRIVADNCPFGQAAVEHPVLCAIEQGLVKGMLSALSGGDATPHSQESIAKGDPICATRV